MRKKFNFCLGAAASSWLLAIMVMAAELYAPFKALLAAVFAHHWIGKAALTAAAFVVFGFLLKERKTDERLAWRSILGSLAVIFAFYVLEFIV